MNNKFTGKGRYALANGAEYTGDFVEDIPEGIGTIVFPNFDTYEGHWSDGEMSGFGIYRFYNSKLDKLKGFYEGEFSHSMFNGLGKMVYPNSSVFYGQWKDNKKHGLGQFIGCTGEQVMGKWENDTLVEGVYIFPDGSKYTGHFKNNKFNGFGSLILIDGAIQQGVWAENVLVEGLSYTATEEVNNIINNQVLIIKDEG